MYVLYCCEVVLYLQSEMIEDEEEILNNLFSSLFLVHPPSIARWNVDKSVKEEKGGEPFMVIQKHRELEQESRCHERMSEL